MSKEKLSKGHEKIFFNYLMEHPDQIEKVENFYFKDDEIQYVYSIIKEDYLIQKQKQVPSIHQTLAMIKSRDGKQISPDVLKSLFNSDNGKYSKEWIESRFKAWKISNKLRDNLNESIVFIKSIDELDYDNVTSVSAKIKQLYSELNVLEDAQDLALDFDDPESHKQELNLNQVSTGWGCLDTILEGGWSYSTLNVIVAQTSGGKSMFMQNMAVKLVEQGKNVLYVTLEMSSKKCIKRMGAMRLRINIKDYDNLSKDSTFIKDKIKSVKSVNGGIFETKSGKLFTIKYPTSSLTITDLDNYITNFEQKYKIKLDSVIVDYLNIMGVEKGSEVNKNNLFLKGKHLAEGLRYIGDKHNLIMITGTQTDKDVWDANDLSLNDIPESKAVAETADVVWGIIRNPEMKKQNKFRMKILKYRDGENKGEMINLDFNTMYLSMENDTFVTPK